MIHAPRRLLVTGGPGSGKSHLAATLSDALGVPHIELDALYHGPDWTPADPEVFRAKGGQVHQISSGLGRKLTRFRTRGFTDAPS